MTSKFGKDLPFTVEEFSELFDDYMGKIQVLADPNSEDYYNHIECLLLNTVANIVQTVGLDPHRTAFSVVATLKALVDSGVVMSHEGVEPDQLDS